jgi:hypothetical protein
MMPKTGFRRVNKLSLYLLHRLGDWRLAAHPPIADTAIATATLTMGMVKLPVRWVILPTAHMASAPTSDPNALRVPAAVEI